MIFSNDNDELFDEELRDEQIRHDLEESLELYPTEKSSTKLKYDRNGEPI